MGNQGCTVDSIALDPQAAVDLMEAALTKLLAVLPKVEELPPVLFRPMLCERLAVLEETSRLLSPERRRAWMTRVFSMVAALLEASPAVARVRRRPRGHMGDFRMMEDIYRHAEGANGASAWSRIYQTLPAVQAVRNRKAFFVALFGEMLAAGQRGLRLLDVGSGSAREVVEAMSAHHPDPGHTVIELVDTDPDALAYAAALLEPAGTEGHTVHLHQQNVVVFRPRGTYDLIWCAGLFDYLEDRIAISLLARLWPRLAPDGQLVIGNFHPCNLTRTIMEWLEGWFLIHRTESQLLSLAASAGIPAGACRVRSEPLGINRFLVATR